MRLPEEVWTLKSYRWTGDPGFDVGVHVDGITSKDVADATPYIYVRTDLSRDDVSLIHCSEDSEWFPSEQVPPLSEWEAYALTSSCFQGLQPHEGRGLLDICIFKEIH